MRISTYLQIAIVLATIVFAGIYFIYEASFRAKKYEQFERHASVLENALWNLDPESPVEYLTLAAEAGDISKVSVIDSFGVEFLNVTGASNTRLDDFFISLGLINEEPHSVPIIKNDEVIGHLNILYVHKTIYFHLYILSILGLCLFAFLFFLRTLRAKRTLESRVEERTAELADAVKAVQESEEKFRAFSEQTVQGIMAYQNNRFIYCNDAVAKMFSVSQEEILAWSEDEFLENVATNNHHQTIKRHISEDYGPVVWRTRQINDESKWIESISRKITFQGQVANLLILNDITDRKSIEEELRHREKMDSVGELAGGIAHDFNNMLGGILGAAEILGLRLEARDPRQDQVKIIVMAATRAADLTSKLLAFSRKGRMETRSFDLHDTIKDVFSLSSLSLEKKIRLTHSLSAQTSVISGDPSQIQNAILNLVVNARDAIDDEGEIIVSTSQVELDYAFCSSSPFEIEPGLYLEVSVKDNGQGISSNHLQKIFDPFFTTKEFGKGTGLGLSAVYGTIKNHKGAIAVYSEENVGTVFSLYFPLADAEGKNDLPEYAQQLELYKGEGTILVVDDEEVIRDTAGLILRDLGYEVLFATDGAEGVAVFKQHQKKISLVLLDMVMPKMNGPECHNEIKKLSPNTAVILCSGFTGSKAIDELLAKGANGFIKKPYAASELSKLIAATLQGDK